MIWFQLDNKEQRAHFLPTVKHLTDSGWWQIYTYFKLNVKKMCFLKQQVVWYELEIYLLAETILQADMTPCRLNLYDELTLGETDQYLF